MRSRLGRLLADTRPLSSNASVARGERPLMCEYATAISRSRRFASEERGR